MAVSEVQADLMPGVRDLPRNGRPPPEHQPAWVGLVAAMFKARSAARLEPGKRKVAPDILNHRLVAWTVYPDGKERLMIRRRHVEPLKADYDYVLMHLPETLVVAEALELPENENGYGAEFKLAPKPAHDAEERT